MTYGDFNTSESETEEYTISYEEEVENRLAALEAKAHEKCEGAGSGDTERVAALEARIDDLVASLKKLRMVREVL